MAWKIIGIAGPVKGKTWGTTPGCMTAGRMDDCDIVIPDPRVSRRHCEFLSDDHTLRLKDLGSHNTTCVNGKPASTLELRVGDHVAIGPATFLIADEVRTDNDPSDTDDETLTIYESQTIYLQKEPGAGVADRRAREYQSLFQVMRQASSIASSRELLDLLNAKLNTLFKPTAIWVARTSGAGRPLLFSAETVHPGHPASRPNQLMLKALSELGAQLLPEVMVDNWRVSMMAAPLSVRSQAIGAVAVQRASGAGRYTQDDLELLLALCAALAPVIYSLQAMEALQHDVDRLRRRAGETAMLIGRGEVLQCVRNLIEDAAPSDLNVLITGETGTGKELAARMVHQTSLRARGPFIIVNCAAIPRELFESEFFGHEKGAFTGATDRRIGLFEQANLGSLFLDEVGDLSLENQARILRALEMGTFRRIGGSDELRADVRVIAATNRPMHEAVRGGMVREDLLHRLNGFAITMPPLRDHLDDIPDLAEHFLAFAWESAKHPLKGFTPEAIESLRQQRWPGNVRQLRNVINRAASQVKGEWITPDLLVLNAAPEREEQAQVIPQISMAEMERRHITGVYEQCKYNILETARILELSRTTIYRRLEEYGIRVGD